MCISVLNFVILNIYISISNYFRPTLYTYPARKAIQISAIEHKMYRGKPDTT